MRGRVDAQFGVPYSNPAMTSPNLIQQFDYGIAASELLQLKEKTPYPTLGDVVHPVLLIDDLRASGRQAKRRWFVGGLGFNGAFAEFPCFAIKNLNPLGSNSLVVVDWFRLSTPSANQELFFISSNVGVGQLATINPQADGFASLANPTESEVANTQLSPVTGFVRTNGGSTSLGGVAGDQNFTKEAGASNFLEVLGPFVILPDRALAVRLNQIVANQTFAIQAYGHEYPG